MKEIQPPGLKIRRAEVADCATIVRLIRELAEYEKLADQAEATVEGIARHLFGEVRAAEVLLAELPGRPPVGFALFFTNFSTFRGQPGIYLEDLYVERESRGRGIGTALLRRVAWIALDRGAGRLEWSVLDWNEPAIAFYKSRGAVPMDGWTTFRVDRTTLEALAWPEPSDRP